MKKIVLSAALFAASFTTVAQVGVGTTTPKASLEVKGDATTVAKVDGIIAPRITGDQLRAKTGYGADQNGTILYVTAADTAPAGQTVNVTEAGYYYFDATANSNAGEWKSMAMAKSDGNNDAGSAGIGSNYGEVASTTGKVWLDRNLGATSNDASNTASYGDLYQWGRSADGHQLRTSGQLSGQLSDWIADESESDFRTGSSDWLSTANDNLWSGTAAENNPCPSGFRLPTNAELNQERIALNITNSASAASSVLALPVAGDRDHGTGALGGVGSFGRYWSSTVSGTNARHLVFNSGVANMDSFNRAYGASVRCIKD